MQVRGSLGFLAGQPVSATFARHHLIRGALGFVATPQISFASWTNTLGPERSHPAGARIGGERHE